MIERFTPVDQWGQVLTKCMDKDPEGIYVLASDYDALAARLASLCDYLRDQLQGAHLADCGSLRGDDFNPHPKCDCEIDAVLAALRPTDSAVAQEK